MAVVFELEGKVDHAPTKIRNTTRAQTILEKSDIPKKRIHLRGWSVYPRAMGYLDEEFIARMVDRETHHFQISKISLHLHEW